MDRLYPGLFEDEGIDNFRRLSSPSPGQGFGTSTMQGSARRD